ncbi:uncharacterized protein MYCFIDRAFT_82178 [Pseudocercospora fijiensis CIRAD86]|uniref:GPI anchored protein n=1 Tax=Pseudocercospora fijiensis (strain CIRAD86) TaxID=383855 RepID=M3BAC6_PSEFD|nr:uncharacterized protein MYCFIDRAFT_82178 [Pseudocercospora fijiensis CIRAD86]EME86252.1 hypothetical protein MYCFIDRAFT_82178 [Pseudocercospora fijiensis CIRAD86]
MASLFAISALLGVTLAQTSTLTLPFYSYDQQSIVGSVVAVSNQITTLQLACPDNTDGSDCGLFPSQTLIVGPSTYNMFMSAPDGAFTGTQQCSATVCTESNGGSEANFPGSSVTTYDASDVASLPVTVTAGADKLGSGGATTTGGGSESATSTASTGSNASQTTASVTEMSGTAGTATESAATTSSSSAASLRDGGSLAAAFGLLLGSLLL